MPKRGPTPSLIGSTHGTVSIHVAGKKSNCRRCEEDMPKGTICFKVSKPGKMGPGKAYCIDCFSEVLDATQRKLDEIRAKLNPTLETARW